MPAHSADRLNEVLSRQAQRESSARTYAPSLSVAPVAAYGAPGIGADGRTYLDRVAGVGTLALGHNHPDVIATLRADFAAGVPLLGLDMIMITPQKGAFTSELLSSLPGILWGRTRMRSCGPSGADPGRLR